MQKGSKSLALFLGAALLAINVAVTLLMEYSKVDGTFPYSPATTVVVSEFMKLIISVIGFQRAFGDDTPPKYTVDAPTILKFAVPGLLYAIANVGNFVVLKYISGTLYQIFNNMKIITTAVVFRAFLGKPLKLIQWICLVFLLIGMVVASPPPDSDVTDEKSGGDLMVGFVIMVIMSLASAFAGVYSEYLLKGSEDNAHYQNGLLYCWGVVICVGQYLYADGGHSFFKGYNLLTWVIILLNAFYGQAVAFTLKYADNIVKVYANSLGSVSTALISWMLFAAPLTLGLLNGSIIVGMSIVMYYCDHSKLLKTDSELWESPTTSTKLEDI